MNIEVSEQTEQVIRAAVESGRFSFAEAFLEAAATAYAAEVRSADASRPTADELVERFKPFRGKIKMTVDEVLEARRHGLR